MNDFDTFKKLPKVQNIAQSGHTVTKSKFVKQKFLYPTPVMAVMGSPILVDPSTE